MQYECVHCELRFEADGGASPDDRDQKPRCPKCLRQHGLRKIDAQKPKNPKLIGMAVGVGVVLVAAAGAGAYFTMRTNERGSLAPLDADDTSARAKAVGVDAGELADLLAPNDAIRAQAERIVSGKNGALEKAAAIQAVLRERASKRAFVTWARLDARAGSAPLAARQVLAKISKDDAREHLYPLEVAALAVAQLRSVDVQASIAEVFRFEGERTALDPSGRLGYYAVAVPGAAPGAAATIYDVYGGRTAAVKPSDVSVLSDEQALAAALALRAMHKLGNLSDPAAALVDADAAIKLAPSSATVRGVRGAVLLASGGSEAGSREVEAAAQLRSDAARRNNLAMVAIAKGDGERAVKEISLALQESPDFAAAHLTLASVHMARGERELARAELEKAQSLDSELPSLALAWAELYASSGDIARAMAKAEEGVRLRPKMPEAHLVLARIYRQASRFDDMRVQARLVVELAGASEKERVKQLVLNLLGPSALEPPTEPTAPSGDSLVLPGSPSDRPLSAPQPDANEPGALQLGGGTQKLRLGGGNGKLKLDLSQ